MASDTCASWRLLMDRYRALVDHPPIDTAAVWRLFVEDPWYQHELHRAASWIARRGRTKTPNLSWRNGPFSNRLTVM